MFEDIVLIFLGTLIAFVSFWAKAIVDRQTIASNELLKQRMACINDIWVQFIKVKKVYFKRMCNDDWLNEHGKNAKEQLDKFREKIEKNQIILPSDVTKAFLELDYYFSALQYDNNKMTSVFRKELNVKLNDLSTAINKSSSKKTHKIHIKLKNN